MVCSAVTIFVFRCAEELQLEKDLSYSFSIHIAGCCDFARLEDEVAKSEVEDENEDERDSRG